MIEARDRHTRRAFLAKCSTLFLGTLAGFSPFSRCFAHPFPRLALIIDDIGHSISRTERFLSLKIPITFSILPQLAHSLDLAEIIHGDHHEIMLHQPMEPYNRRIDPGPGAVYVGDSREKIQDIVYGNIEALPHIKGVNNHMGSKFTEHPTEMSQVLTPIKKEGLFFVDSLTSSHSVGHELARNLHVTTSSRNVFLDHRQDESFILHQLHQLERIARKYGRAIGIGHPYAQTARTLKKYLEYRKDPAINLVYVSRVLTEG